MARGGGPGHQALPMARGRRYSPAMAVTRRLRFIEWARRIIGSDLRPGLFVAAAWAGIVVSLLTAVSNGINGLGIWQTLICLMMAGLGALMLVYARIPGREEAARVLTVVVVFVVVFPVLFFTGGGYHSGMPAFFVLGLAFTAVLLHGVALLVILTVQMAVYLACLALAYARPDLVTSIGSEQSLAIDVAVGVVTAGLGLAFTFYVLLQLHERNQRALTGRNAELAEVDKVRAHFLAMIAHELNTPLAVMRVQLERVGKGPGLPAEASGAIGTTITQVDRLTRLVAQLLDLSRIESGTLSVRRKPEDLSALLQEVLRTYQPLLARNRNRLELSRGGATPTVYVDRERFAQVLVNLLSNAARHTHDGVVSVALRERAGLAEISVSDTGEGISEPVLERIRQHRQVLQPGGMVSSRDAGLGIGLMIAHHIMAAHDGELVVSAKPGEGTTVQLLLPTCPAPE